jgi:hypothetical protein
LRIADCREKAQKAQKEKALLRILRIFAANSLPKTKNAGLRLSGSAVVSTAAFGVPPSALPALGWFGHCARFSAFFRQILANAFP